MDPMSQNGFKMFRWPVRHHFGLILEVFDRVKNDLEMLKMNWSVFMCIRSDTRCIRSDSRGNRGHEPVSMEITG